MHTQSLTGTWQFRQAGAPQGGDEEWLPATVPGGAHTDLLALGRLGEASEIARGVVFLTSDDAGFITGSTLSINGGQHMY